MLRICSLSVLKFCMQHCLYLFLTYGSKTMLWKERSRIRDVQMDNFKGLLVIRRMNRVQNAKIRELCEVTKGVDERIDEGVLRWFGHVEKESKRVYVEECAGSRSVGMPWKRWIDTVKDCLRERVLDVRQARRMVQDSNEWRGFVRGNAWDVAEGKNPRP